LWFIGYSGVGQVASASSRCAPWPRDKSLDILDAESMIAAYNVNLGIKFALFYAGIRAYARDLRLAAPFLGGYLLRSSPRLADKVRRFLVILIRWSMLRRVPTRPSGSTG
jgi:hypothetical protein